MSVTLRKLNNYCLYSAAAFIASIAVIILIQVCANTINRAFLLIAGTSPGLNLPSYNDFVSVFLAAAGALSLAGTFERGAHIRVRLLLANLTQKAERFAEFSCLVFAALASGGLTYGALLMVYESWVFGDVSYGHVPILLWVPQLAILWGLLLLLINILYALWAITFLGQAQYKKSEPQSPE